MDAPAVASVVEGVMPGSGCRAVAAVDRPTIVVSAGRLPETAQVLRDDPALQFEVLTDLTAVDRGVDAEPRFEVIYHLLSPGLRHVLRVKVLLPGDAPRVPTLVPVWTSAGWLEREVWDLFGVVFEGHPDPRRLMMPEDWEGHPLRKDYPVQIRKTPDVYAPLQVTEEEFRAGMVADREVRGGRPGPKTGS